MANELELVAVNAANDGWVDNTPGAVSTGYQNQNIALQAAWNGFDGSTPYISGSNLIIPVGGIIDDSGLPFVIKTQITIALPTSGYNHFLRVIPGTGALQRSIEFTTSRGTYDSTKMAFYDTSGRRILDWIYNYAADEIYKVRRDKPTADIRIGSFLQINSGSGQGLTTGVWTKYANFAAAATDIKGEWNGSTDRWTAKEAGIYHIHACMDFKRVNGSDEFLGVAIYANGAVYARTWINGVQGDGVNTNCNLTVSAIMNLNANDYIEVWAFFDDGSPTPSNEVGGSETNLNIWSETKLF